MNKSNLIKWGKVMSLCAAKAKSSNEVKIKVCDAGLVRCVGEILRGPQVIAFVHLNPFTGTYSVESARTGKIQHWFGSIELLQEFTAKERLKLDMHIEVTCISLSALA